MSIQKKKINLVLDQGTTFTSNTTITNSNNAAVNFYGYTANSMFRKYYTSNTSYTLTVALSNTGVVTLSMNSTSTANVTSGRYVYDVEAIDTANAVIRIMEGVITVTPQVTR
jgi:hypothetical protein